MMTKSISLFMYLRTQRVLEHCSLAQFSRKRGSFIFSPLSTCYFLCHSKLLSREQKDRTEEREERKMKKRVLSHFSSSSERKMKSDTRSRLRQGSGRWCVERENETRIYEMILKQGSDESKEVLELFLPFPRSVEGNK